MNNKKFIIDHLKSQSLMSIEAEIIYLIIKYDFSTLTIYKDDLNLNSRIQDIQGNLICSYDFESSIADVSEKFQSSEVAHISYLKSYFYLKNIDLTIFMFYSNNLSNIDKESLDLNFIEKDYSKKREFLRNYFKKLDLQKKLNQQLPVREKIINQNKL